MKLGGRLLKMTDREERRETTTRLTELLKESERINSDARRQNEKLRKAATVQDKFNEMFGGVI